jgi:O-antigen/teichoic acid export membrane protein
MLKKIIVTLFARGFVAIVNLAILLITSKQLGGDIRGQIALLILNIGIIQIVNEIYTGYALVYFIPRYNLKKIYNIGLVWTPACIILTTLSLVGLNLYYDVTIDIHHYWLHIVILSLIIIVHSFNGVVILAKEKIRIYNFLNFFQPALLLLMLFVLIFGFKLRSVDSYIIALYVSFLSSLLISGIQMIGIFRNDRTELPPGEPSVILRKGFFNQLANLSHMLSNRYNFYLLTNNVLVGIYATSTSLIESVLIISSSASTIILTYIANKKDDEKSITVTFLLSKLCFLLSLFCVFVLLLIPTEFFSFLLGKDFSQTKEVMLLLSPGILCISFSTVISHYFSGMGRQRLIATANLAGLISAIIAGYFLVNRFQLRGACYAACISYFVASIIMVVMFMREHRLSFWSLFRLRKDFKVLREIR